MVNRKYSRLPISRKTGKQTNRQHYPISPHSQIVPVALLRQREITPSPPYQHLPQQSQREQHVSRHAPAPPRKPPKRLCPIHCQTPTIPEEVDHVSAPTRSPDSPRHTQRISSRASARRQDPAGPNTTDVPSHPAERMGWNRNHSHNTRFRERMQVNLSLSGHAFTPSLQDTIKFFDQLTPMVANIEETACLDDGTLNFSYPCTFHKDVLDYGDMLKASDCQKFVTAMETEVQGLRKMFKITPRNSLSEGTNPLPALWALKRK